MTTTQLVEKALKDYPETRNSDKLLIIKVWELQVGKPMNNQLKDFLLHDACSPETIRRNRQKFQEYGRYPAKEEVDEARFEKFKEVRANAPRATRPEQLGLV